MALLDLAATFARSSRGNGQLPQVLQAAGSPPTQAIAQGSAFQQAEEYGGVGPGRPQGIEDEKADQRAQGGLVLLKFGYKCAS